MDHHFIVLCFAIKVEGYQNCNQFAWLTVKSPNQPIFTEITKKINRVIENLFKEIKLTKTKVINSCIWINWAFTIVRWSHTKKIDIKN